MICTVMQIELTHVLDEAPHHVEIVQHAVVAPTDKQREEVTEEATKKRKDR